MYSYFVFVASESESKKHPYSSPSLYLLSSTYAHVEEVAQSPINHCPRDARPGTPGHHSTRRRVLVLTPPRPHSSLLTRDELCTVAPLPCVCSYVSHSLPRLSTGHWHVVINIIVVEVVTVLCALCCSLFAGYVQLPTQGARASLSADITAMAMAMAMC